MDQIELKIICEDLINESVTDIKPLTGGDTNQAYQIETKQNNYFCKTNETQVGKDLLHKEQIGLRTIGRYCTTPEYIGSAPKVLLLSWVKSARKTRFFWEKLGVELAAVHRVTSNQYGFDHHNYIGTLIQHNEPRSTWENFFVEQRLLPQFKMAVDKSLLHGTEVPKSETLAKKIKEVCPKELASLIHGDLWSGNILADTDSNAYFVDPCVSYAHREMDIAMSTLFGKFDNIFYEAYNEAYPLAEGWKNRLDIYHLYFLLAHLNMFGIGYKNDVMKIVANYFK